MTGKKHQAVVDNMRRGGIGPAMGGGSGPREYCSTCGRWIEGSFESHKGSREHQDKVRRRGSGPKNSGGAGAANAPASEAKEKTDEDSKSVSVRCDCLDTEKNLVCYYLNYKHLAGYTSVYYSILDRPVALKL